MFDETTLSEVAQSKPELFNEETIRKIADEAIKISNSERFNICKSIFSAVLKYFELNPQKRTSEKFIFLYDKALEIIKRDHSALYEEYVLSEKNKHIPSDPHAGLHVDGSPEKKQEISRPAAQESAKAQTSKIPDWMVKDAELKSRRNPPDAENK